MTDDLLKRAQALVPAGAGMPSRLEARRPEYSLDKVRDTLSKSRTGLDAYLIFDTTGSMQTYIDAARQSIDDLTSELLKNGDDVRISINGIGDHCDGEQWLQMYALSKKPEEVKGAIESIVLTNGGDEPEAYECLATILAKRLPKESEGRKRVVVLVADSLPHGMNDEECQYCSGGYKNAFSAMKVVTDGFYLVGCNLQTYSQQRELIDSSNPEKEQFIPLGKMVGVLTPLMVALAKKQQSEKALLGYLNNLSLSNPETAKAVRGLLAAGK